MAKENDPLLDKGGTAEEALRSYFKSLGSYVVRGAKVRAGRDHVTDIDLWVYTRASVHARNIAIVDIKNKRKSKGYERLIWLRGLQEAVGADEAIVATNSSKEDLRPFAKRLNIDLLSNQVFKAVVSRYSENSDRFSSEEIESQWRGLKVDETKNLHVLIENCLVELGLGLNFSAMNIWIDEAAKLLVHCHDHERKLGPCARAALFLASLVAICGDYMGRTMAFSDPDTKRAFFREGLIFGKSEEGTADRYINFAEKVATDFVDGSGAAAASIRSGFQSAVANLPVSGFIDFFSRPTAGRDLFDAAIQLENAAFSKSDPDFSMLPPEAKTIIGLLIDYAGLSRKRFLVRDSGARLPNDATATENAPRNPAEQGDIGRLL